MTHSRAISVTILLLRLIFHSYIQYIIAAGVRDGFVSLSLSLSRIINNYSLIVAAEVKQALSLADDSNEYQKYVAMYDFTARNFDELSLKAGDHVMVNVLPSLCLSSSVFICLSSVGYSITGRLDAHLMELIIRLVMQCILTL